MSDEVSEKKKKAWPRNYVVTGQDNDQNYSLCDDDDAFQTVCVIGKGAFRTPKERHAVACLFSAASDFRATVGRLLGLVVEREMPSDTTLRAIYDDLRQTCRKADGLLSKHTPPELADRKSRGLTYDKWQAELDDLLPPSWNDLRLDLSSDAYRLMYEADLSYEAVSEAYGRVSY